MTNGKPCDWIWRPVTSGRHGFPRSVRESAAPDSVVTSFCGVEVDAWQVLRIPSEMEWIKEATCMDCWKIIASRT